MQTHQNRLLELFWMRGLRNDPVDYKDMKGIREFNLSHNRLTDHAVDFITRGIKNEGVLRSFNLRANRLSA